MFFNLLTVILVFVLLTFGIAIIAARINPYDENDEVALSAAATLTLIFMWVMSWQNWWR